MISALLYLLSILGANLLVIKYGVISLGWLTFPAGAVLIGLTFSMRDFVQRRYGKWRCWWWMLLATVITTVLNLNLAVASGAAFLISEACDWYIFTTTRLPFKKRIFWSNLLGTPIDSLFFVTIAFGFSLPVIVGQTIVKFVSSLLVLPFVRGDNDLQ